jgi:hypothetical protein
MAWPSRRVTLAPPAKPGHRRSPKSRGGSDGRITLKAMLRSVARAHCERSSSSASIRAVDGVWPLFLADHLANRRQQPKFGVNNLKIAHVAKDLAALLPTALHFLPTLFRKID